MTFNWNIDVGHLLTVLAMFLAISAAATRSFYRVEKKLDRLENQVRLLWQWFKRVHKIDEDVEPSGEWEE